MTFYAAVVRRDAKNFPEGGFKRNNSIENDGILVSQVQILEEIDEIGANEMAQGLSYEIRNGKIDWKRAVVINELLKHQHFR